MVMLWAFVMNGPKLIRVGPLIGAFILVTILVTLLYFSLALNLLEKVDYSLISFKLGLVP